MGDGPCKHEGPEVLLVEGKDDCHVIMALCQRHQVPENFGIYECGNDTKALGRMNALIPSPSPPRVIGLIIDADRPDLAGRWASIVAKLSKHGYEFPAVPTPTGTIIEPPDGPIVESKCDLPRIGVWLMPDNRVDGMLEDFCGDMMAPAAAATAEECLQIAEARGHTSFKAAHRPKALVHTYLAWQDEPGCPLGLAITRHALDADTPTARVFAEWLTRLFSE